MKHLRRPTATLGSTGMIFRSQPTSLRRALADFIAHYHAEEQSREKQRVAVSIRRNRTEQAQKSRAPSRAARRAAEVLQLRRMNFLILRPYPNTSCQPFERVVQNAPCRHRIKISKSPGIQADFVIRHRQAKVFACVNSLTLFGVPRV